MALYTIIFGSLSYTENSSLAKARFPCPTELEFQLNPNLSEFALNTVILMKSVCPFAILWKCIVFR